MLFSSSTEFAWSQPTCSITYNVYVFEGAALQDTDGDGLADDYGACFLSGLTIPQTSDSNDPPSGQMRTYVITGENLSGEGSMGFNSQLQERPTTAPCP